jgi:hypothetical protein
VAGEKSDSTAGSSIPGLMALSIAGEATDLPSATAHSLGPTWPQAPYPRHGQIPSRRTEGS